MAANACSDSVEPSVVTRIRLKVLMTAGGPCPPSGSYAQGMLSRGSDRALRRKGGRSNDQEGDPRRPQEFVGDAPHHPAADPDAAVGRHGDQSGLLLKGGLQDLLRRVALLQQRLQRDTAG